MMNPKEKTNAKRKIFDRAIIDILDPPSAPDIDAAASMIKQSYKKSLGIEDLYFLKLGDEYHNNKYICVSAKRFATLETRLKRFEITEDWEIAEMNNNKEIRFPEIGGVYYDLDSLKRDWLALKISGVE